MSVHPGPIQALVDELKRLPGIGPRSASRLAFHLLRQPLDDVTRLATVLEEARRELKECSTCAAWTDVDPCRTCSDASRDQTMLCVVEDAEDLLAIERSGEYRGVYHVLHGALSPVRGVGPEALRFEELLRRVRSGEFREVIAATNPNVEGEATALYLSRLLAEEGLSVTRVAQGLPAGTSLDHVDELTIARALQGRRTT
ncbi:MAG: recombination mediator RecR [Acidobacteriota bacterium]